MNRGVLKGVRVLDFSRLAPAPMAAMMLGDLGASVIKVEEPGGGRRVQEERELRSSDSYDVDDREVRERRNNPLERNKRSIALNLKDPAGRDAAMRLVKGADVLIEGYRPGVMDRLGLGYDSVAAVNPRVVYCSITGFGQVGPRSARVGHDLNYQADAGALSLFAALDTGRPIVPPNLVGDYAGGTFQAVIGILGALFARTEHGRGQYIDVSMTDGVLALLTLEYAAYNRTGIAPKGGSTRLTGMMAQYNTYETRDGKFITLGCNEPAFFRELCRLLGLENLIPLQLQDDKQIELKEAISAAIRRYNIDELETLFSGSDVAYAPIRSIAQIDKDHHYRARGMFQRPISELDLAEQIASPLHFSLDQTTAPVAAPLPGEHSEELLLELGMARPEVDHLFNTGAVTGLRSAREEPECQQ